MVAALLENNKPLYLNGSHKQDTIVHFVWQKIFGIRPKVEEKINLTRDGEMTNTLLLHSQ